MSKWRVTIQRADGRRHYATVTQVNRNSEWIVVEWNEDGHKLTKQISFEEIRELNNSFDDRLKFISLDSSGNVEVPKAPPMVRTAFVPPRMRSRTNEAHYSNRAPKSFDSEDSD